MPVFYHSKDVKILDQNGIYENIWSIFYKKRLISLFESAFPFGKRGSGIDKNMLTFLRKYGGKLLRTSACMKKNNGMFFPVDENIPLSFAREERLELPTLGFGDRCSTN